MTRGCAQLCSREQEVVLRTIAAAAAAPGATFLEVGSWCGDSTLVLGAVARGYDGKVFCVDWWKGSYGTELADEARGADIFARFWDRIVAAGLDDTVVPIRARSDVAAAALAERRFDLVFIDGDHSYRGVERDIRLFAPLVRIGGILCGHDCEGRIEDFDRSFLQAGAAVDYHETVHCGVVLAVGEFAPAYSIDHSVWSMRRTGDGAWAPTALAFPGIAGRTQVPPPPLLETARHILFRVGRYVHAVPHDLLPGRDITDRALREDPRVRRSETIAGMLRELGEQPIERSTPALVEAYEGFNIVRYEGSFFGIAAAAGHVDVPLLGHAEREELGRRHAFVAGETLADAKRLIERARLAAALDEASGREAARAATLADRERRANEAQREIETLRDLLRVRDAVLESLKKAADERDASIAALRETIAERDARLERLRGECRELRERCAAAEAAIERGRRRGLARFFALLRRTCAPSPSPEDRTTGGTP